MTMSRYAKATLLFLYLLVCAVKTASAGERQDEVQWLALERMDLFHILIEGTNIEPSALQAIEACLVRAHENDAADETLWFVRLPAFPFNIMMTGIGMRVHTVSVSLPMERFLEEEAEDSIPSGLSNLFEALYPDWPEAEKWPQQSAMEVLSKFPYNREAPRNEQGDIQTSRNGITSTTIGAVFGIDYLITVRGVPADPSERDLASLFDRRRAPVVVECGE